MKKLTLKQLTNNICKGETNYIRLVRHSAYRAFISYNKVAPTYRSYEEQLAITYKNLDFILGLKLEAKDDREINNFYHKKGGE